MDATDGFQKCQLAELSVVWAFPSSSDKCWVDLIIWAHSAVKEKLFCLCNAKGSFTPPRYGQGRGEASCRTMFHIQRCVLQCLAQRTKWRNTKQLRIVTSGERRRKQEEWRMEERGLSQFFFFLNISVVWIFYNNNIFLYDLCDFKRTIKDSFNQGEMGSLFTMLLKG